MEDAADVVVVPQEKHRTKKSFWRKHASKFAIGAGMIVVTGISDSVRAQITALTDRLFHRTLQKASLVWIPVDCPGHADDAAVGVGGCEASQRRELSWLAAQLRLLAAGHVRGVDGLAPSFELVPVTAHDVKNVRLELRAANGDVIGFLGVGYSVEKNANDGCLRLYTATKIPKLITPILCIDGSDRWWSKETDADDAVRLKL